MTSRVESSKLLRAVQKNGVDTKRRTGQIVSQVRGSPAHLPPDLTQFALVQFAAFSKCKILTKGTASGNELHDGTRFCALPTVDTVMSSTKHKPIFLFLPRVFIRPAQKRSG